MAPRGKGKKVQNQNDDTEEIIEVDEDEKDRASWGGELNKTFIRLCLDEKEKGNMPTTHFNSQGWENIIARFSKETKRSYTRAQLKNRWDNMKKEWTLWTMIKSKATGLGWDPVRQTPVASKAWWNEMAKVNKNVLKFKKRGLEQEDDYRELFSKATATGNNAWAPSQGLASEEPYVPQPPDQTSGYDDVSTEDIRRYDIEDGYEQPQSPENVVQVEESDSPNDDTITRINKGKKRAISDGQSGLVRKRKRLTGADKICDAFDRMASQMEHRTAITSSLINNISVKEVFNVLNQVPGLTKMSPLYMLACTLFSKPYNREIFINFGDNDLRLYWLKYMELKEPPINFSQHDQFSNVFSQLLAQPPSTLPQQSTIPFSVFSRFAHSLSGIPQVPQPSN